MLEKRRINGEILEILFEVKFAVHVEVFLVEDKEIHEGLEEGTRTDSLF